MSKLFIQQIEGVYHHAVNGKVISPSVLKDHGYPVTNEQRAAYDAETAKFLDDYYKARLNMTEEQKAEEAFERRAAFGEGVEVVNVLTGEKWTT